MGVCEINDLYQNLIEIAKSAEKCLLQPQYLGNENQNFYHSMWGYRECSYKVSLKSAQASRRSSLTHTQTDRQTLVIYY